ncbi:hypothetical protein BO70DRAFT_388646 [Aspergillus heteromorphus CBS 117.55]|uniref:Peptide hydrolase n=1 Tax=Aspergillus heteromorphus CBS 117.55 TaxID=1448321 RepID=A0A317VPQ0_9EURO|nr:uncharacterized protein BO70DRAFT_388646 [Aspergillus heteromorphus CBS 117.55]PWY76326.1 hypothetical protein BO70DRAFT_388646 [Aspergillus heteromorphus CBS 117.55]
MPRQRQPARFASEAPSDTSTSTSPDRTADDDTDFFTAQANDSQSSVGIATRDANLHIDAEMILPPIGRLPPEILIAIFAKLSAPSDMLSCMLTITTSVSKPDGFFPYSELIRRLNLSALTEGVSDGTVVPFAQCNRIERLTLTNCSKLTDKGVSDLVEGNRHLQALDVSDLRHLTDHTLYTVARNCARLQGLNITGCVNMTDESLITVSRNCRQIKRLKLNGVSQVTDKAIMSFAINCPAILEIDLHDCKHVTNPSVTALMATLQNLRELRLAHCTEIDDTAFLQLPRHLSMDSLRILDLTSCESVRDDAVERIVASAPRLRNLVLAKCRFITDRAVWAICKLGKNLHYVHLGHCSNISDAAVTQLVKSCNRIRYIDLACCTRLTDSSVQQLATLPKLRRIGLVKCQSITDNSINALAGSKAAHHSGGVSSLERVHLSYCIRLSVAGIHALLNSCPRLTHLSLTGVQAFLRDELTVFCREAPPEFTNQQREVFCVFSGDGVNRLRDFLNRIIPPPPPRDLAEATMYDEDDELDEEENPVTGLMHATAATVIHDDDYIDIGHTHETNHLRERGRLGRHHSLPAPSAMAPRLARANPLAFTRWPVTLITTTVYLAFVIPLLIVHHVLPSPPASNPTGLDLTEAWADLQVLTDGFHPYNSRRNDDVHAWLLQRIDEIVTSTPPSSAYSTHDEDKPDVFVFDDTHSNLTFVGNPLKSANTGVYFEGTNILVYIRGQDDSRTQWWLEPNGVPPAGQSGGVLVNAHYDSVSTGYGATDDGVGVVSCLQLIKYFTTPGHVPRKGLVVLFNNGEEDYLNGARVYGQHPIARFPHTFVNLEGAGAGGRAILFRSSDTEVTRPYMRSKYPFGSILAANGFEVGLISSQTDYVVFEGDMGLRGLDVAFMEPRASRGSLWHMLSAAVATTEGLVGDKSGQFDGASREDARVASGEGSKAVWFDLFGTTFVVFQLHTLFALSVTLLIVAPLTLLMYLFRTSVKLEDTLESVPLQGLRVNPLIVHSSEYAVWSMMLSAWMFLAWFVSRVAEFARPSALHRVYTLTWIFVLGWVMLVIATVYENKWGLAGGYFVFFFFSGTFVATWISYLELFSLPRKSDYALQCAPVSRRASSYGGSRLGTASGEEHDGAVHDGDEDDDEEDEPTESTSLLGGGQRTTFANYVRVTGDNHNHADGSDIDEDPNVYKYEQRWSAGLPKWTWVLQFLLIAPLVLIMVGPLALLLTSALHQTAQDGSSPLFVYTAVAALSTLLLTPLLPFIHRHTYHIPLFLLLVFAGTLIYNLVAFPFSPSNRLKLFFLQEIDLTSGANSVSLSGVQPYVLDAASTLPSAAGQDITCVDHTARGTKCSWTGLAPRVITDNDDPNTPLSNWLNYTITKSKSSPSKGEKTGKPNSARITLSGRNTRACKLLFDSPVSSFEVLGSAYDPRFPSSSPLGTKEIRLWSREWENEWTVDVSWSDADESEESVADGSVAEREDEEREGKITLTGHAVCLWSDHNQVGAIPALDEVKQFGPVWVAVSKAADGLVEGRKRFSV